MKTPQVLPTFLYIGASKAGSSWIYEVLREHPDIYVPAAKDVYFFDRHYDRGLAWYAELFAPGASHHARGELSHDYYLSSEVAERIRRDLPEAKLLVCLREPIDWLVSAYLFNLTTHVHGDESLESYAARPEVVRQMDYLARLEPFYALFPREQISVRFYDDLRRDPKRFASELYAFVGVDPAFVPSVLETQVNAAREPRNERMAHLTFRVAQVFRKLGMVNFVGAVKRSPALNALLFKPQHERPTVAEATRKTLFEHHAKSYDALARLVGRPLPAAWYRAGAPSEAEG